MRTWTLYPPRLRLAHLMLACAFMVVVSTTMVPPRGTAQELGGPFTAWLFWSWCALAAFGPALYLPSRLILHDDGWVRLYRPVGHTAFPAQDIARVRLRVTAPEWCSRRLPRLCPFDGHATIWVRGHVVPQHAVVRREEFYGFLACVCTLSPTIRLEYHPWLPMLGGEVTLEQLGHKLGIPVRPN